MDPEIDEMSRKRTFLVMASAFTQLCGQSLDIFSDQDAKQRMRKKSNMPSVETTIKPKEPTDVYSNNERSFYIDCRLRRAEFEDLHRELEHILNGRTFMTKDSSSRRVLFIILEWLAHKNSFSRIVSKWGGSESTISRMLEEMLPPISKFLYQKHIFWLTEDEKKDHSKCFPGFPGAISAVDCVRFVLCKGTDKDVADLFYSKDRKLFCLKVQVWCTWQGRILYVCSTPELVAGRRHELTILRSTPIALQHEQYFGGEYAGIGDGAYVGASPPSSMNIFAPYPRNSREFDLTFNRMLSRNRIIIENVFGHVMARWKRLFHEIWVLGGSTKGDERHKLMPETINLAFALTQRLFELRGYPRSDDWLTGTPMIWENDVVIDDDGVPAGRTMDRLNIFAERLDEDPSDSEEEC